MEHMINRMAEITKSNNLDCFQYLTKTNSSPQGANHRTSVEVRPNKRRKLIMSADESENENNLVVPPIQGEVSTRASAPSSSSATQGISMLVVENSTIGRTIMQVLRSDDEACKPIVAELEQLLTVLETPGSKVLQNLGLLFKIKSLIQQIS
ncbi:unnamed protein product [Prunus armeniaca]|uniref:Uncharacterized protein n=1 Tax=Prunus armeniaca TaxID=36596 RepID=A0A6J5X7R7_PRUAR|nr:unnamed protein product [Prunus armeniaca]